MDKSKSNLKQEVKYTENSKSMIISRKSDRIEELQCEVLLFYWLLIMLAEIGLKQQGKYLKMVVQLIKNLLSQVESPQSLLAVGRSPEKWNGNMPSILWAFLVPR